MFKLTGTRAMLDALGEVGGAMQANSRRAADGEAERILEAAKPRVPVQTGRLLDSGRVESSVGVAGAEASVSFGGDGVDYAIPVHERPGDGHKFLERPFRDAETGMDGRIARVVKP